MERQLPLKLLFGRQRILVYRLIGSERVSGTLSLYLNEGGLGLLRVSNHAPGEPEVTQLDLTQIVYENVCRLDISVHDPSRMEKVEGA